MLSPNRIVVIATPMFVGLSGWLVEMAARYLPGTPHLDSNELTAVFAAGALAALTAALSWLRGWQKHEAHEMKMEAVLIASTAEPDGTGIDAFDMMAPEDKP